MESVSRVMTREMLDINKEMTRLDKYCDALKNRVFIRTKTIVNAGMVYEAKRTRFWKLVTKTWPETITWSNATIRCDETILFTK